MRGLLARKVAIGSNNEVGYPDTYQFGRPGPSRLAAYHASLVNGNFSVHFPLPGNAFTTILNNLRGV